VQCRLCRHRYARGLGAPDPTIPPFRRQFRGPAKLD